MCRCGCLLLTCSLVAFTACNGPVEDALDPLAPAGGSVAEPDRSTLGEFTIHFDRDGGRIEMSGSADGRVPSESVRDLLAEARILAPEGDVGLETIARGNNPPGGTCAADADWGFTVELTNNGGETWYTPLAQLSVIAPGSVTACNSASTGELLPDGGAVAAEWTYGSQLASGASASAQWGFTSTQATSFSVRGVITIGDPPTCGGVSAGTLGVCSGHGTCVAEDTCDCDPGYEQSGAGDCVEEEPACTVQFDFEGDDEEELSVVEGEIVWLIKEVGAWCLVRNQSGEEGYVPTPYLECDSY